MSLLGIRDEDGAPRRFIILKYARTYQVWDRHNCSAATGYIRLPSVAEVIRDTKNKEWRASCAA